MTPHRAGGAGAMPAPPPAFFDFAAPAGWRAIDLVSDLHLNEETPRTFDALAAHLSGTSADAVWILGDLFERWVGDDAAGGPFERRCADMLAAAASRGLHVGFMHGNRDFLVGSALAQAAGMTLLPDPTRLDAWGRRIVLTHGDALCLADAPYQAFRAQVRSPAWQQAFLARPLSERLAIAGEIRHASEQRRVDGLADYADVDRDEARLWLQAAGAAVMVNGHTHRPADHDLGEGMRRHVLSDWDLDHATPRADVLRITRDGIRRVAPAGVGVHGLASQHH